MIAAPGSGSGWARYTDDLSTSLQEGGVEIVVEYVAEPLRFKKLFLLSWLTAIKIYLKQRKAKIDVIHCVVEPCAFISYLLSLFMRVPYVITFHGTYSIFLLHNHWFKRFQRLAYSKASALVAVSRYTKGRVLENFPSLDITVVPNGIKRAPDSVLRTPLPAHVIMGVGGLKHRKGYHLVIEALSRAREKLSPFTYYIVGTQFDMDYVERLRSLVEKHGLEKEVVMTGPMSDGELDALYSQADLFVLTPVSDGLQFEGFGLVYLEANARGIPVVGMMGSGAEEAVKDGFSGRLARMNDVDDLALIMESVLENEKSYRKLSENAIQWADKMQWDNVANIYRDTYERII